jgi:predicted nucleic acid-binding protein
MFDENDHPERVRPFWSAVFDGKIRVVLSDVLEDEIARAPQHIRDFYRTIPESQIERVVSTSESNMLAERYVAEGVVGQSSLDDCRHVAIASIAGVDVLVSFNCTHIVKLNRIRKYNGINMLSGYSQIEIRTPDEVIHDEI